MPAKSLPPFQRVRLDDLLKATASAFGLTTFSVLGASRAARHVKARRTLCALADEAGYSTAEIARFAGLDHASAKYHIGKCPTVASRDSAFAARLAEARLVLTNSPMSKVIQDMKAAQKIAEEKAQQAADIKVVSGPPPIADETRAEIRRLRDRGWSRNGIAKRLGIDSRAVERVLGINYFSKEEAA